MVEIRRIGSSGIKRFSKGINERRHAKADKAYAEAYRKAYNIRETHQEKLERQRNEESKKLQSKLGKSKSYSERARIIGRIIRLRNRKHKHSTKGLPTHGSKKRGFFS